MPETFWTVRWPDGTEDELYSPSTVIAQHFAAGDRHPLDAFVARARIALMEASARVEAKYGRPCSAAMGQLARIEATAARQPAGEVACLSLSEEPRS